MYRLQKRGAGPSGHPVTTVPRTNTGNLAYNTMWGKDPAAPLPPKLTPAEVRGISVKMPDERNFMPKPSDGNAAVPTPSHQKAAAPRPLSPNGIEVVPPPPGQDRWKVMTTDPDTGAHLKPPPSPVEGRPRSASASSSTGAQRHIERFGDGPKSPT